MFQKILTQLKGSSLFKASGTYTLATIMQSAIPFLLLPLLTHYLSPKDYGIVAMFGVLVGITTPFLGLGIRSAVLRSYFKKEVENFPQYLFNALIILGVTSIIVSIVFFVFAESLSSLVSFPKDWLFAVVLVSACQVGVNVTLVIWQAKFQALKFGIFQICLVMVNIGLSVLFIVVYKYGWEGRILGQLIAFVLFFIVGLIILFRSKLVFPKFNYAYVKHIIFYGLPLIPHSLSGFIITAIDRVFITNMVGVEETGIYVVAYQIGMVIDILGNSFNKAWSPWLFSQLNKGGEVVKRKIVRLSYYCIGGILILAVLLSLSAPFFIKIIVSEEFYGATKFIFWVSLGCGFNAAYYIVVNYIMYAEKNHMLSWVTMSIALLNVILNFYLIPIFGALGAAYATTICYFIFFLSAWYISNRVYPMPWITVFNRRVKE